MQLFGVSNFLTRIGKSLIKSARVVQVAILMEGECIVAHLLFISIAKEIIISSVVLMNLVSIL